MFDSVPHPQPSAWHVAALPQHEFLKCMSARLQTKGGGQRDEQDTAPALRANSRVGGEGRKNGARVTFSCFLVFGLPPS